MSNNIEDYTELIRNLYYNLNSFINYLLKNIQYNNYTLSANELLLIILGCKYHPELYDLFLEKLLTSNIKTIEIDYIFLHKKCNIFFSKLIDTLKKFKYPINIMFLYSDLLLNDDIDNIYFKDNCQELCKTYKSILYILQKM